MPPRVLLIGGSSHAGKSSVAAVLGRRLGWEVTSTDSLARHPGRPWRAAPESVPRHVVEHFSRLRTDELVADVVAHYEAMWPALVEPLIRARCVGSGGPGLVLEGSALLPALAVPTPGAAVRSVWLIGQAPLLTDRIAANSAAIAGDAAQPRLIGAFAARSEAFDALVRAQGRERGCATLEIDPCEPTEALAERCLAAAGL